MDERCCLFGSVVRVIAPTSEHDAVDGDAAAGQRTRSTRRHESRLSGDNLQVAGADKQDLRAEFLQQRRTLTPAAVTAARASVRAAVLTRCEAAGWTTIAAYLPLRTEPGSLELLDELMGQGVRVLVPMTLPDRDLDWVALADKAPAFIADPGSARRSWPSPPPVDRTPVPLGVSAITSAEAVLVPALAVAADGTRLGRGGGSYDRALARVSPGVPVAALLYDGEVLAHLPRDKWDISVTAYVTPAAGWRDLT